VSEVEKLSSFGYATNTSQGERGKKRLNCTKELLVELE